MKWTKGEPPKTFTQTPVRIQFADANTNGKQTDSFVWLARENAWASTSDGGRLLPICRRWVQNPSLAQMMRGLLNHSSVN